MSNNILSEKNTIVLREAAKWAKIFGIITIVSLIASLLQVMATSAGNTTLLLTMVFTTLLSSSISIALVIFLLNFNKFITKGLETNEMYFIERGLNNFKWYFALNGILLIIALSFLFIGLFVALIVGAVAA